MPRYAETAPDVEGQARLGLVRFGGGAYLRFLGLSLGEAGEGAVAGAKAWRKASA